MRYGIAVSRVNIRLFGFIWVLISLLAIVLSFDYSIFALIFSGLGGLGLGVFFHKYGSRVPAESFFNIGLQRFFLCVPNDVLKYGFVGLLVAFLCVIDLKFAGFFFALYIGFLYIQKKTSYAFCFTPPDFSVVSLLVVSGISLYVSPDWISSRSYFFTLVASIFFAYAIIAFSDTEKRIENFTNAFVIVGGSIALGALFLMQKPNVKLPLIWVVFDLLPDFFYRRVHSNYVGGILTLFLPLSFWYLIFRKQILFFVIFVNLSLGLLLSQSRSAILGIVLALVITGIIERKWVMWVVLFFCAGIGVLSFGMGWGGIGAFAHTWETRKELWERAIYIVEDFPITGIGMHTFSMVTDMLYPLSRAWSGAQVPHVHNLYLQVVVDIGLFGFVAFMALIGKWVCLMWETLYLTGLGTKWRTLRPLALGLCGGGIAHLIYSLTDAIVLGEKAGVFVWINLGLTVALWQFVKTENI